MPERARKSPLPSVAEIRAQLTKREDIEKPKTERVSTGIKELDEVMEGGFERGSINLVIGGPGCGKSIFATQFLYDGAVNHNEPGMYISFEESKEKFYRHMECFGWDLEALEKEGKFVFLKYSPDQVNKLIQEGGGVIDSTIFKMNIKRLVIDSITALTLLYRDEYEKRSAILQLFSMIEHWGCTALIIAEEMQSIDKQTSDMLEFAADGVIALYYFKKQTGDVRERALEILKMRGTKHSSKIFPMRIGEHGIKIYTQESLL